MLDKFAEENHPVKKPTWRCLGSGYQCTEWGSTVTGKWTWDSDISNSRRRMELGLVSDKCSARYGYCCYGGQIQL